MVTEEPRQLTPRSDLDCARSPALGETLEAAKRPRCPVIGNDAPRRDNLRKIPLVPEAGNGTEQLTNPVPDWRTRV